MGVDSYELITTYLWLTVLWKKPFIGILMSNGDPATCFCPETSL